MRVIGNILWFLLGGFVVFLFYVTGAIALCLTIIGIPFGWQVLKLAWLSLVPFGHDIQHVEGSTGCLSILMNVVWIVFGGIWVAFTHLLLAALFGITIIGIPFARQHIKLMGMAFAPFGVVLRDLDKDRELISPRALPSGKR